MPGDVKRRRYDSRLRAAQAAETRRKIVLAAQRLFERDGYAVTSMADVASAAGVSLKTVYLAFETKSGVLRAVWHRVLRGERDDVPVWEQPWYAEVLEEADPERQLRLNMRNAVRVRKRAGAVLEVIRTAAATDPNIAALWGRIQSEFYANQRTVVESIASKGALAEGLDVAGASDMLWALNHPSLYALLTVDRGWTPERCEQWIGDLLCATLLR